MCRSRRAAYQLEVRRSSDYGISLPPPVPYILLTRSFDTNDRLSQQVQVAAPAGEAIAEAETFALYDGVNRVTFEFDDLSINNGVGDGVASGHVPIPFYPSDNDVTIARRIRDAINSDSVQAVLQIAAATSDGAATGAVSTSQLLNLYGNAIVELAEVDLGVTGQINDDYALFFNDVFQFVNSSTAGESITSITISVPSGLGFYDFSGVWPPVVSVSSDSVGPTFNLVDGGADLTIDFTDFAAGEQFVFGVNVIFNSFVLAYGSDLVGSTVSVAFDSGRVVTSSFRDDQVAGNGVAAILNLSSLSTEIFDELGDENLFRDQGQILIHSNSIKYSADYGIVVDSGQRETPEEIPHAGPVRNLRELNQSRWRLA